MTTSDRDLALQERLKDASKRLQETRVENHPCRWTRFRGQYVVIGPSHLVFAGALVAVWNQTRQESVPVRIHSTLGSGDGETIGFVKRFSKPSGHLPQ